MSNSRELELSIIVPAYNEAKRILPTLTSLVDALERRGYHHEILVVDDGSVDETVAVVEAFAVLHPSVRAVLCEVNRGKGAAVRRGMLEARGQVRVMCDADGSMPPSQLDALIAPVASGRADIAIGSRRADGASVGVKQPWFRRAWSVVANAVVRKSLVSGIRDTQCGFKAFSAHAARSLFARAKIDGWAFDLEVLAIAQRMGYVVDEVPVVWEDDPRSRIRPVRDAINVAREALAIRRNLRAGVYGRLELVHAACSASFAQCG